MITNIYLFIAAYFIGSILGAIVIKYIFNTPDPRQYGSLNAGTTNILRVAGKSAAAATFMFDTTKSITTLLVCRYYFATTTVTEALVLAFIVLGHIKPVFFNFKGGKGVATFYAGTLCLNWPLGLITIASWLLILISTKISSLAALSSLIIHIIVSIWYYRNALDVLTVLLIIDVLIIWCHSSNIARLLQKSEYKI